MSSEFDARSYWQERLSGDFSVASVGFAGLGESYNAWMYRVRRRVFLSEVRRLSIDPRQSRVLDVGSGTGFYLDRWHELGAAEITGSDLTSVAVNNLRIRYPEDRIFEFDIGSSTNPLGGDQFTAISMMDVLFHLVSDEAYTRALSNAAALLAPGGFLIFSDCFLRGDAIRLPHVVFRPLDQVQAIVETTGLGLVRRRPLFVLMNEPVDSASRALRAWWHFLHKTVERGERAGAAMGRSLYPLEVGLVNVLRQGPSTEIMVCRQPA
jgi:SAM-dependent methyltransferase